MWRQGSSVSKGQRWHEWRGVLPIATALGLWLAVALGVVAPLDRALASLKADRAVAKEQSVNRRSVARYAPSVPRPDDRPR